ncbi:MAG: transglutaminase domain-containing protein, partial [Anaerolineales bacterium]|nr:transglutaminase domain-containing protein [Candidatus Desulfolinea nitratireducens]
MGALIELTINALLLYTQRMQKSFTRWRDIPAIILFAMILFTSSARLVSTDWTPDLEVARNVSLLSLLLGLALGISRLKKFGVILLTLSFSILIVPWQLLSIIDQKHLLITRITKGSSRLLSGFNQLAERQPVDDHIFFIMLMVMVFWFTGLYASYVFVRYQNIIAALFPSTLIILIVQYYDQTSETSFWSIGIYFLFVFVLLGRLNFLENKERWQRENVFTDPGIGLDISIITLSATAIIVLFAWSIPSSRAEWAAIASWWQNSTGSLTDAQKQLGNAFASIDEKPVEDSGDLYKSRLLLGERPFQNNQILFTAHISDGRLAQRYYWKLRVYDIYEDGYWSHSQDTLTRFIPSMVEIHPPNTDTSFFQEFVFTNKIPSQSVLLTVQQPINISSNTQVVYTPLPDGTMDISRLLAQSSLNSNESYTIKSALAEPTIAKMRQAGTEYPDWVVERYLQLPEDFPESIRELAAELSLNQETPYDQAFAITSYLRSEIFYDEKIPSPPQDQDPIEWFLFTWKRGFCNYSASANVVMLRAVGIPA